MANMFFFVQTLAFKSQLILNLPFYRLGRWDKSLVLGPSGPANLRLSRLLVKKVGLCGSFPRWRGFSKPMPTDRLIAISQPVDAFRRASWMPPAIALALRYGRKAFFSRGTSPPGFEPRTFLLDEKAT